MAAPRILTFNFHEPYLCLMAKTGLPLTVGLYRDPPLARPWQTRFRPVPENITFLDEREWRRELGTGAFDVRGPLAPMLQGGDVREMTPLGSTAAGARGLAVLGPFLYVTNEVGFQIIDLR